MKNPKCRHKVTLRGSLAGKGLVENGKLLDSMKSATPDVPAESNDGQRKCNGRVLSTPFHVKKSVQAAAVATEPGGEETYHDV